MEREKFERLGIINNEDEFLRKKFKIYDKFLYGKAMIEQLKTKKIGNEISYYEITEVLSNGNVLYDVVIETLE